MKGDPEILKALNTILRNELTAINQFFLHARILEDWGLTKMGKHEYGESIEEMQHADELIQRILFLEGLPNLQELGRLMIGESVREVLECDLKMEYKAREDLQNAIAVAESLRDYTTRDLLGRILKDEESHIDYLETQLRNMDLQGEQNYIQIQSDPHITAA